MGEIVTESDKVVTESINEFDSLVDEVAFTIDVAEETEEASEETNLKIAEVDENFAPDVLIAESADEQMELEAQLADGSDDSDASIILEENVESSEAPKVSLTEKKSEEVNLTTVNTTVESHAQSEETLEIQHLSVSESEEEIDIEESSEVDVKESEDELVNVETTKDEFVLSTVDS